MKRLAGALLSGAGLLAVLLPSHARAQYAKPVCSTGTNTTTISGVVYSPNGQDPLPDVLVYVPGTAGAVAIPEGVTSTDLRPQAPLTETTTAYDGSFMLTDAPAGTSIPLVIQSGKWQRQLVVTTVSACQANTPADPSGDRFARFPRNRTEGFIPHIGIVTGTREATECILRKVGMDDAEFTNFGGGGRINIYLGGRSPGSRINASTPGELDLMNDAAQVNSFDLLMFPCQGSDQPTTAAGMSNLASFANNGGRLFVNHHSHAWLKNNDGFANTLVWAADGAQANAGPATIDQSFTIGATLALWLQNLQQTTTQGAISVTNVFASLGSLTSNSQQWITLNSNSLPIQASFDTPVGAGAGKTYGRVLYNEYHVSPANSANTVFPAECSSSPMSQQEKILEFSLFDLSTFATISKVDAGMTLTASPNPAKFGAQVTATATLTTPSGSTYPTPTGAVTFSEGSTAIGTAVLKSGSAAETLSNLSPGTHTITAAYTGDPYYTSRTATVTVTVYPQATVSVSANPNPVFTGHASTITLVAGSTGSALPTPTGSAAITVDGVTTSYPLVNGVATVPSRIYSNGTHAITGVYSGDDNYASQTATTTLYVQVVSSTTLQVSSPDVFLLNPAVFTATAIGTGDVTPGGTMTFYEAGSVLGTASLANGSATLSLSNLPFGQHTVTASYSGDSFYGPSSSNSTVENVMDYQLSVTKSSDNILHSATATYTFTVTPLGGTAMPSNISLSVSGMRLGSVLTLSPASVAAGSGTTAVTATMKTSDAPSQPAGILAASLLRPTGRMLALAILLLPFRRSRKTTQRLLAVVLALLVSGAVIGCGTGWNTQTYRMTLVTNSGALQHSSDLTLTERGR